MNQETAQQRKKILFVITKSNFGGAQRYVYDLATNLPKGQFEVAVVFGGTNAAGGASGKLADMLATAHVRTLRVTELGRDISVLQDWRSLVALMRVFRSERPDVIHLNSSKAGGLGAFAGRLCGVPHIIFTAHGWYFWERRSKPVLMLTFILSYLTVLLTHRTICISEFDKRALAGLPFARRKISVIRNGISEVDFFSHHDARTALYSSHEIEAHADDIWVLSNGELTDNKNYFVALDTIAQYNASAQHKIYYSIMSDGEQRTQIEKYITEKNLTDQVKLLGFVSDGRRYYKAFDIFFLPSKKEGVPYVILEAGAARLPVVASNVGGIPEVVTDGESGYLRASDDILEFTEALGRLAEDPSLRERIGKALERKIAGDFSLTTMLEQTILLY